MTCRCTAGLPNSTPGGGCLTQCTILRFRHRLKKHKLADAILATVNELLSSQGLMPKEGSAVDATLIAAPSSTKNKEGNQWHFGMKAYIGVDAASGLVHTVLGTAGHVADVTEGNSLLHGEETVVYADSGYRGADKRLDTRLNARWQVAMRAGKRKNLDKANSPIDALIDKIEKCKAGIRAKVEHPFRVVKRQFGFVKVRYRGLKKNTLQLKTLFALSNLWMARHQLRAAQG